MSLPEKLIGMAPEDLTACLCFFSLPLEGLDYACKPSASADKVKLING